MSKECVALSNKLSGATKISILIAARDVLEPDTLHWVTTAVQNKLLVVEVDINSARDNACLAFKEALEAAGMNFNEIPDSVIFTPTQWHKYYERGRATDMAFVYVFSDMDALKRMFTHFITLVRYPETETQLFKSTISSVQKSDWWKTHWKDVLLVGGGAALAGALSYAIYKAIQKKKEKHGASLLGDGE